MFYKLNHQHSITSKEHGNLNHQYGMVIDGVWRGLKYYDLDRSTSEIVKEYIPQGSAGFDYKLMVINNHYIPPHIDDGPNAALNFYIDTDAQKTIFYDNTNITKKVTANHKSARGGYWDEKDLTPVTSFCAAPTDIYLLDISKIHSVMADKVSKDRTVLTIQSVYITFDEWADWLREKGKL